MKNIELAKELIVRRDFKTLDDLWTEIIMDRQVKLDDLFKIATELKKCGESERVFLLLDILVSHLESEAEYDKAIEVYKNMLRYSKEDPKIRKKLVGLYNRLYKDSRHINDYIEISGINKTAPIFQAIEKLEEFLHYDIGKCFYFERYGIGEVIDTVPSKKEVVINFEKKERHFLTLAVAKGLLLPITEEHFLYKKYKNISELKEMVLSQPTETIKFMLKSFKKPLTTSQIKMHLDGIVEKSALNKWWEKTRKNLGKDKTIKVSGKTLKNYTYVESGVDRDEEAIIAFEKATPKEKYLLAQDYVKKMPEVFKHIFPQLVELGNKKYEHDPALALDILLLCNSSKFKPGLLYTIDKIFENVKPEDIIKNLNNLEHQHRLLKIIEERNPDTWPDIFESLLFSVDNSKLLDEIARLLQGVPDKLNELYYSIFSMPKQHLEQYQWLLKKIQKGSLTEYLNPKFIPRFIDSLGYVKGIKTTINKILSLENFDKMLRKTKEEDARRIIEAINSSSILTDYEKKNYLRIVEYYFPHFFAKKIDVVYTTEDALNRKKEELNRIYTIKIPENKKEISRAREFGDLSDNFEYKAAKERQDQLYQKLKMLNAELEKAVIIDLRKIDTSSVNIGTRVTLKNLKKDKLINYTILGRWDTDLEKNIISNEAPIAQSLLSKECGDKVILNDIEYEIINIEKGL